VTCTPAIISTIRFADTVISCFKADRILAVTINRYSHLTSDKHITSVMQSCNHIRSLRHIWRLIDKDTAVTLACSISSRLDYCRTLPSGITSKPIINRLQHVQNSLARVMCKCTISRLLSTTWEAYCMHWLSVEQRLQHKNAVMRMRHQQPLYPREYTSGHLPARSLRSIRRKCY